MGASLLAARVPPPRLLKDWAHWGAASLPLGVTPTPKTLMEPLQPAEVSPPVI